MQAAAHFLYCTVTGELMYLAQKTMPELSNTFRELALHMDAPGKEHVKKMGRVVGYAKAS